MNKGQAAKTDNDDGTGNPQTATQLKVIAYFFGQTAGLGQKHTYGHHNQAQAQAEKQGHGQTLRNPAGGDGREQSSYTGRTGNNAAGYSQQQQMPEISTLLSGRLGMGVAVQMIVVRVAMIMVVMVVSMVVVVGMVKVVGGVVVMSMVMAVTVIMVVIAVIVVMAEQMNMTVGGLAGQPHPQHPDAGYEDQGGRNKTHPVMQGILGETVGQQRGNNAQEYHAEGVRNSHNHPEDDTVDRPAPRPDHIGADQGFAVARFKGMKGAEHGGAEVQHYIYLFHCNALY